MVGETAPKRQAGSSVAARLKLASFNGAFNAFGSRVPANERRKPATRSMQPGKIRRARSIARSPRPFLRFNEPQPSKTGLAVQIESRRFEPVQGELICRLLYADPRETLQQGKTRLSIALCQRAFRCRRDRDPMAWPWPNLGFQGRDHHAVMDGAAVVQWPRQVKITAARKTTVLS